MTLNWFVSLFSSHSDIQYCLVPTSIMKILVSSIDNWSRVISASLVIAESLGASGRGSESDGRSTGQSHAGARQTVETERLCQTESPGQCKVS